MKSPQHETIDLLEHLGLLRKYDTLEMGEGGPFGWEAIERLVAAQQVLFAAWLRESCDNYDLALKVEQGRVIAWAKETSWRPKALNPEHPDDPDDPR